MKKYNIVFAGTPVFAVSALTALIQSHHHIQAVYTQPDRPAGRGRHLTPSAVKQCALENQLPIYQPNTLRDPTVQAELAELQPDLMIVVAYGMILPQAVLNIPRLGCINIHGSLLPRWRGAAPIQRAILSGDTHTGITIMHMEAGLDTGPMLSQESCDILKTDTSQILHDRLAHIGASLLVSTLNRLDEICPIPQNSAHATYAEKLKKEEAPLDWTLSAIECDRQIRAFNPWPIATCKSGAEIIRIFDAQVIDEETQHATPGTIIRTSQEGIDVATGRGTLRLLTLQWPGKRALPISASLNAHQKELTTGNQFF